MCWALKPQPNKPRSKGYDHYIVLCFAAPGGVSFHNTNCSKFTSKKFLLWLDQNSWCQFWVSSLISRYSFSRVDSFGDTSNFISRMLESGSRGPTQSRVTLSERTCFNRRTTYSSQQNIKLHEQMPQTIDLMTISVVHLNRKAKGQSTKHNYTVLSKQCKHEYIHRLNYHWDSTLTDVEAEVKPTPQFKGVGSRLPNFFMFLIPTLNPFTRFTSTINVDTISGLSRHSHCS